MACCSSKKARNINILLVLIGAIGAGVLFTDEKCPDGYVEAESVSTCSIGDFECRKDTTILTAQCTDKTFEDYAYASLMLIVIGLFGLMIHYCCPNCCGSQEITVQQTNSVTLPEQHKQTGYPPSSPPTNPEHTVQMVSGQTVPGQPVHQKQSEY